MAGSGGNNNTSDIFPDDDDTNIINQFANNTNTTTTVSSVISNYYNDSSVIFTIDPSDINNITSDYYENDRDINSSFNFSDSNTTGSSIMDTITTTSPPLSPISPMDSATATEQQITQFYIGVALSISSSLFIGLSFIIKKKALIRLSRGGKRANQGGYGYLKDLLWWSGLLSMAVGEAANFMAYTFASATLVSTLGVLSVLVTAILSSKYLHERLNFLGKIGCILCTIGSTVIVIHAPMEKDIESMEDLAVKMTNIVFVFYVILTIVVSLILIYHYRPKLPETSTYTLLIWIGVCSMIGSLSVMSVKGLGLALIRTVTGIENELTNWITWFCFISLIICISVQMNFLNKALDTFNTAVVTPIYYVFFTSCVIIASAILFNEFAYLPIKDWVGLACGFFTVLTAIVLLHLCKNFDFTLVNLAQQIDLVNDSHNSNLGGNGGGGGHHHLNLHIGLGGGGSGHEHVKGDNHQLPYTSSSGGSLSTSCAIPGLRDIDLKQHGGGGGIVGGVGGRDLDDDEEEDSDLEENELFKSVGSHFNSPRGKKGPSPLSLSPDQRLLSGSYSSASGARNRDGYIPLNYGTTDNRVNF